MERSEIKTTTVSPNRRWLRESYHLFTLNCLGLALPLLQTLRGQPEFFLSHNLAASFPLVLTLALLVPLPLALSFLGRILMAFSDGLYRFYYRVVLGGLVFVCFLPLAKSLTAVLGIAICLVGAVVFVVLYERYDEVRRWVGFLGLGLIVIPAYFLMEPSIRNFITGYQKEPEAKYYQVDPETNLIVLVLDELQLAELMNADEAVDAKRFPNFGRLASDATWFKNAVTFSDQTKVVMPGVLSSRIPGEQEIGTYVNFPNSLFTLFGKSMKAELHERLTRVNPAPKARSTSSPAQVSADLRILLLYALAPRELSQRLPIVTNTWGNFLAHEGRYEDFVASLDSIKKPEDGRKLFFYYHLVLPHFPYTYMPSGKVYDSSDDAYATGTDPLNQKWTDEWAAKQAAQRHLLQLGATDKLLGLLLDRLQEQGLYEDSLVVVFADHGVSFREGDDFRRLSATNYSDVIPVPFFLKAPNQQEGRVDERQVSLLDVLPTVAHYLGVEVPWSTAGIDLTRPIPPVKSFSVIQAYVRPRAYFKFEAGEHFRDSLKLKLARFGSGDWSRVYNIGPVSEIVDKRVDQLEVKDSPVSVEFRYPSLFEDVSNTDNFWPCRIRGTLSPAPQSGAPVALSINDVVAGTTWAGPDGAFSCMVPESAFKEGFNEVSGFLVETSDQTVTLARLNRVRQTGFSLDSAGDLVRGELQYRMDNSIFEVETKRSESPDSITIKGWVFSPVLRTPAEQIVILLDGEEIVSSPVSAFSAPAATLFGAVGKDSGFNVKIPRRLLKGRDDDFRVFAVARQYAAELKPKLQREED